MNYRLYERLYLGLREFISQSVDYSVEVQKKPYGDIYPTVVFQEIASNSISNVSFTESHSSYTYQIDIYAKRIGNRDGAEIARELSEVCSKMFDNELRFKRVLCRPTPNIDITIDRYTMQYQAKASDFRGRFY